MRFLTRTASKNLRTAKGIAEWDRRWAEYEKHFASIKSALTTGWRRVGETDFHDTVVWSVERPRKSEVILRVDMTPRWQQPPLRVCTLRFTGVRDADIPDRATHDRWLYDEVDRAEDGCGELRVLLRESQFRIASRDVDWTTNFDDAATAPRFSRRAIEYLEDFAARREETQLGLKLEAALCCDSGDDSLRYDGPHLQPYGPGGTYSASCMDPITISVGSRSFVMSAADMQATGGRYVELLPVQSANGLTCMYVLAIV